MRQTVGGWAQRLSATSLNIELLNGKMYWCGINVPVKACLFVSLTSACAVSRDFKCNPEQKCQKSIKWYRLIALIWCFYPKPLTIFLSCTYLPDTLMVASCHARHWPQHQEQQFSVFSKDSPTMWTEGAWIKRPNPQLMDDLLNLLSQI